ncbi:DUF7384 family protein [Halomarina oriensis]|uniref:PIN domain-containing protein n=1 Tax=Halomarina oriensis TaxID=671145 RepID=A0A6B0GHB5_9EURY|nr:hypothetical protein [Halomarina oriensis]MWG34262.1 hypothetical protein [Halomarina oriensis]
MSEGDDESGSDGTPESVHATRVVADADVLAADLLVGGASRDALDLVRSHSWVDLVASDHLLDDAEAVVAALADATLAADWRARVTALRVPVDHPAGDHPAVASALHGDAAHLLTLDDGLQSAKAGATIRGLVETSVKAPAAFAALFDPESVYPGLFDGPYPGPDRDPRE